MYIISVIVPLYNGEKTISRCLDSLIKQNMQDMEVIVVDDGSIDSGAEIVKKYVEIDSRIKLLSQTNQGAGAARNRGIKEATGKYVGFLDCDDFVDANMYHVMVEALESTGMSVAVCQEKNVYIDDGNIRVISETKFHANEIVVYPSEDILKWQLNYTFLSLNSMCYKVVKRAIFIENGIEVPAPHRYAEDLVASVGIFTHVESVVIVPKSMYYYVHERNSTSYSYSLHNAEDVYLDLIEVLKYVEKSGKVINTDNFSLGMNFSSLKQIYWSKNREDKNSIQAKKLKKKWSEIRKKEKWKPDSSEVEMPFMHKVKVYVSYLRLARPMLFVISKLRWIPFFKYMS